MIHKLFYSNNNKKAIKYIINENINKNLNININNNFDLIINDTMDYVISQVNKEPPKGMKHEEYIFLMNKKVYDLIMPIIKQNNKPPDNKPLDNIFDSLLLNNYETPPIMEYPKPSITINNDNISNKIKKLEDERSTLIPKIRPIDFTIKDENINNKNTMQMYNELLTSYNNNEETPILDINTILDTNVNNNANNINIKQIYNKEIPNLDINTEDTLNLDMNTDAKQIYNDHKSSILISDVNFVEKKFILTIDSSYRDLYEYPLQTSFQFKLAPTCNNIVYNTYYDDNDTLILYEKTISYGNMNINETFDNIKSIKFISVNVPNVINIYKESYTYLVIPELKGFYKSNNILLDNAFAKLMIPIGSNNNNTTTNFTILTTSEQFIYDSILNSKLDMMTLNFVNKNGKLFHFGIDKLYIEKFMEGTKIVIQNSNTLLTNDLIYFYDTRPTHDQIVYLEDYINISKLIYDFTNNKLKISASYSKKNDLGEMKNIPIHFKDIIPMIDKDYYIILYDKKTNKYYYLKIDSFSGKSVIVIYKNNEKMSLSEYKNIRIGIAKSNLRGLNNNDPQSLFYNGGYYITSKENNDDDATLLIIEINYPYNNLTDYLKDEVFIIQDKMQLSYTFEITLY